MNIRTTIESSLGCSTAAWQKADDTRYDSYWHNPTDGMSIGIERVSGWGDYDTSVLPRPRVTLSSPDNTSTLNDRESLSFIEDNGDTLLTITE